MVSGNLSYNTGVKFWNWEVGGTAGNEYCQWEYSEIDGDNLNAVIFFSFDKSEFTAEILVDGETKVAYSDKTKTDLKGLVKRFAVDLLPRM